MVKTLLVKMNLMPTWKRAQDRLKVQRKIKLATLVLLTLALLLAASLLVKFWQKNAKNYSWGGEGNINLAIKGKDSYLFSFDPQDKRVTIVLIDGESYIEIPGGFGDWQVRAIYDLGELEKGQGATFLKKSLSQFLGIPVDGFIKMDDPPRQLIDQHPLNYLSLLSRMETDLTPLELGRLFWGLSQIRFDKVKEVGVDSLVQSDLYESRIRTEDLTIAVYNGTKEPGLAAKVARLITNMGGNVIIQNNAPTDQSQSLIFSASGGGTYTLKRLSRVLSLKVGKEDALKGTSRAQINIFLGER